MISNPTYGKIKNGNQTTNQHGIWRIPPCPAWCQGCAVGSPGSLQNKWALQQQKCGLTSKGRRQLSCFTRGAQWPQSLRDRRCYIDVSTCLSFSNILILHHILPIYIYYIIISFFCFSFTSVTFLRRCHGKSIRWVTSPIFTLSGHPG